MGTAAVEDEEGRGDLPAQRPRRNITDLKGRISSEDTVRILIRSLPDSRESAGAFEESIQTYQKQIEDQVASGLEGTLDIDFATIGKLAQSYQYGERLARGLATSKAEVIIEILPPLVKDIFAVFLAVNVITNDPPELVRKRQSEFITRADGVLVQYYGGQKQITERGT